MDWSPNATTCLIPGPIWTTIPNCTQMQSAVLSQCIGETDRQTDTHTQTTDGWRKCSMTIGHFCFIESYAWPNNSVNLSLLDVFIRQLMKQWRSDTTTCIRTLCCCYVCMYVSWRGRALSARRHRPPTGPYAMIPKQFSVIAEFYILKCCRVSQHWDVGPG